MRRFELVLGTSSKFWEVEARGTTLTVRYGRIGTAGQTKEKRFASADQAAKEAEKLIHEKTGKGYREIGGGRAGGAKGKEAVGPKAGSQARATATAKSTAKTKATSTAKTKATSTSTSTSTAKTTSTSTSTTKTTSTSTSTAKTKAKEPSAVAPTNAKTTPAMPVPGASDRRPGQFALTQEQDELFARGWPNLFVLTDEPVAPAVARKTAKAALQALDPYLPTLLPRDVARRVLLGYLHDPFEEADAMQQAIASDRAIDEKLLRELIPVKFSHLGGRGETYPFRMWETLYLFETFLGAEAVLAAMVEHCLRAMESTDPWGKTAFWIDHSNANFRRVVPGIGWLRFRMDEKRYRAAVKPLSKGHPKLPVYSATLRALADDTSSLEDVDDDDQFALQRRDKALVATFSRSRDWLWSDPQVAYVIGASSMLEGDLRKILREPKWKQQRRVAELGIIRGAGTVRMMAGLLESRSVGVLAADWLRAHAHDLVKEALPVLDARKADAALATTIRGLLGGAQQAPPPSPRELKKELALILKELPSKMKACKDDEAKERATITAAFERYCAIQAALGEIIPEAYFTHQLDLDWKADRARVGRWIDMAVEAGYG